MSERDIDALTDAVIDGERVDWAAVQSSLAASPQGGIVDELHWLSRMRAAGSPVAATLKPRLPGLLEWARALAIAWALVGAVLLLIGPLYPMLLVVLLAFAGGASYLDLGGRDRRARSLAACYWMVAAAFSTGGFKGLLDWTSNAPWAHMMIGLRPEAFFAAGLWQFAREFPTVTRFGRLDRVCATGLRLATGLGVALFTINVLLAMSPRSALAAWASPLDGVAPGSGYWTLIFAAALPALLTIALRARFAEGPEERRAKFFLYAIALSFLPLVLEVMAEGLFPEYRNLIRTPRGQLIGGLVIYPLQILLPFATAYAVIVDNILEVRLLVHRAAHYLLARTLIAWGAAVPFLGLLLFAYRHRSEPLTEVLDTPYARALVWVGVAAIGLVLSRSFVLRLLDRWALPGLESGATTLARLTEALRNARTPMEVLVAFATHIERALQASVETYVESSGQLTPLDPGGVRFPPHSLIQVALEAARQPCTLAKDLPGSYYYLVTEADRRWIDQHRFAMAIPVIAGRIRKRQLGALLVRQRRNALGFSDDDRRFLQTALGTASIVADLLEAESPQPRDRTSEPDEFATQCPLCGLVADWSSSSANCDCGGVWARAALPKRVGNRFAVARVLGAGGMGVVYRATDLTLRRDVALKTITHMSEDAGDRLAQEARAMAAASHANIAVLYEVIVWRHTPLLVMEHLAGGTLAQRLAGPPLPVGDALSLVSELAAALVDLHAEGRYHGDIKPSNIGFTAKGVPKFMDFGLSRAIAISTERDDDGPATGGGTWIYMPPEVREGGVPGPALDVWALLIVLCECVTGQHPFPRATRPQQMVTGVESVTRALNDSYGALRDLIVAGLSPSFDRQPQTAASLAAELIKLRSSYRDRDYSGGT